MTLLIPPEILAEYRARNFRLLPELRLHERCQAVDFVNQRGFIFFWPISGVDLPSLWTAVAGDRPVADAHDDPGHVTWGWKDSLLGSNQWYYAKILRQKATMLSMAVAPYFYALSENYGAYETDYLTQYEQGRLTLEARQVYEAILVEGPLDTVALRRITHMTSPGSESRFNRALADLQSDFKIVPVAVTRSGAWHYAFAYDAVARHYPNLPEQAHSIQETTARQKLVLLYFRSLGVARPAELVKLFGWKAPQVQRALSSLVASGDLLTGVEIENRPGDWLALSELLYNEN